MICGSRLYRLVATVAFPAILGAQTEKQFFAPIVLLLPSGPRTMALGNVGVASRDDEVLFFNPAQLAIARGMSASTERYSATSYGGALSAVTRVATGGVAVGLRMVNYETPLAGLPANRAGMLEPGNVGSAMEASIGLAQVYKSIRFGMAGKYAEDERGPFRAGRGLVDFGLSRDFMRFYTVGLAVQNVGPELKIACGEAPACPGGTAQAGTGSVELPLRTTLGAAMVRAAGPVDLVGTAGLTLQRGDFLIPAGGLEVGYSWLDGYSIVVRAGARRPMLGESALTGGLGFTMDRLSIDYAVEMLSSSHAGQRIGLRVR